MKNRFLLSILSITIFFSSCTIYKIFDFGQIQLGMTKQQVSEKLKRKPYQILGAKQYPNGSMELQEYVYIPATGNAKDYWLYFWNDKLVKYESPELRGKIRPNVWQDEIDKTYYNLQLDRAK